MINSVIAAIQLVFTMIIGMYFLQQMRSQHGIKPGMNEETKRDMERLNKMRRVHLSRPLTEQTRPQSFDEIVGQEDGIKAVKAALFGANPQHILIYGPPGVGKTAASRVAMEEAKKSPGTPFAKDAVFVEADATTMHYDERSIADPLIGSVHDPIYQGAGALGAAGIPQPKEGAVSKAHGGVLFIDEIGELQPIQMNRLLKVLEDRKVHFESSYYSSDNKNIPPYIHELFKNGMPADFRLIGATTRRPEEIPPALRSRCVEIFFNALNEDDLFKICSNAIAKLNITVEDALRKKICRYASNGRDVVKMLQTTAGKLALEERNIADEADIDWVIRCGRYRPKYSFMVDNCKKVGVVNALAVTGDGIGMLLPIEISASYCRGGRVCCGGICESETVKFGNRAISGKSSAKSSLDNVLTVLSEKFSIPVSDYNITINFPGGMPVDGPSAGIALFAACYSALNKTEISNKIAMTGELSIMGGVNPVGGVREKIEGAKNSGAETVIIPAANYYGDLDRLGVKILPVHTIDEVVGYICGKPEQGAEYGENSEAVAVSGCGQPAF